jgi:hypothetical protein
VNRSPRSPIRTCGNPRTRTSSYSVLRGTLRSWAASPASSKGSVSRPDSVTACRFEESLPPQRRGDRGSRRVRANGHIEHRTCIPLTSVRDVGKSPNPQTALASARAVIPRAFHPPPDPSAGATAHPSAQTTNRTTVERSNEPRIHGPGIARWTHWVHNSAFAQMQSARVSLRDFSGTEASCGEPTGPFRSFPVACAPAPEKSRSADRSEEGPKVAYALPRSTRSQRALAALAT